MISLVKCNCNPEKIIFLEKCDEDEFESRKSLLLPIILLFYLLIFIKMFK